MITAKGLRWSGTAISNGRQRLTTVPPRARFYSITSSRTSLLTGCTTRSRHRSTYRYSIEQARSISLWGWGSSTSKDADFAKIHSPESNPVPDSALGNDGQILAQHVSPSSPSIPAVHQTSDIPPTTSFLPDPPATPSAQSSSPLDQIIGTPESTSPVETLDLAEVLSAVPERIGYLKEVCGIDFGWGPSSMMEMLLEHIHVYSGLGWATSIVLLAVSARTLIFFPMLKASDVGAKLKIAQPVIAPARQRLREAHKANDYQKMAEAKAEINALQKEYRINPLVAFVPILVQVPLQFGGFRVLRNMAELPVPALMTEHWLWTQDLTLGDPYFILPVVNSAILYLTIKRGGETGTSQVQSGLMITLSYILPVMSFVFMTFQPGAVQIYFFTSALLAFAQSRLLTSNPFRKLFGLHPTVPNSPPQLAPPPPSYLSSPTSATSSTTSTAAATPPPPPPPPPPTSAIAPGGLKLYQPPTRLPTQTPTSPPKVQNISLIDKVVDNFKAQGSKLKGGFSAHGSKLKGGIYTAMGTTKEKRNADAREEAMKQRDEAYEARVKREEDWRARVERSGGLGEEREQREVEWRRAEGYRRRVEGEEREREKLRKGRKRVR